LRTSARSPPSTPLSGQVRLTACEAIHSYNVSGIYTASKAALEAVGETLRLELDPFGVKVVSVLTGEVQRQFYLNQTHQLPPTSYHLQSSDAIARKAENQGVKGMDTTTFAKQVVDDLLGGANGKVVRAKQNAALRSLKSSVSSIMVS
jgi:1-acylglycerone phosphate reductase